MLFFNKPINDVTYEDVVAFCEKSVPEGKQLDYKFFLPKNNEKFAKTIASFANALGGVIVIGVKDDSNDSPKPPFTGIPFQFKIRNKIEDIIQTYIDPIVFVDINVCGDDKGNMFVVVSIPQSNLTPHLVGKMKRAYIRTGQSSRPEIIVHPDRLPWLLNHRKKSESLRHILLDKAERHFDNHLKSLNIKSDGAKGILALSLAPLYPQEPLVEYRSLRAIMEDIYPGSTVKTVQDGITKTTQDGTGILEFNSYGLSYLKTALAQDGKLDFFTLARNVKEFFEASIKLQKKLGFGGPLNLRFSISNARGIEVFYKERSSSVLEDFIRKDDITNSSEIEGFTKSFVEKILSQAAWALDLDLTEEEISSLAQ
ncbi:hypothetical protein Dip510_002071 [Elusimicrobium posterum]|uniref:AlbA family DNA-binding domain-containing protein n=1 Tax=Elusimicrobium posterum TaxID=3116653 RepID=UPI003C7861EC